MGDLAMRSYGLSRIALSDLDHAPPLSGAPSSNRETLWDADFIRRLRLVRDGLTALINLPLDWDSYGARPIDASCLRAAFDVLKSVMREDTPVPSIVPTSDGHVQFEWHARAIDLEVEVVSSTAIHVLYEDHAGKEPPQELFLSYDLRPLSGFVHELTRRP